MTVEGGEQVIRVTSFNHPIVKLARALGTAHGRKKHGLVLLEGPRAVLAALEAGAQARAALLTSAVLAGAQPSALVRRLIKDRIPIYRLPDAMYRQISLVEAPQGVALLCVPPQLELQMALHGDFLLVVDQLRDPGNLGSLLRSAQAFGVDAVITTCGSVEAANPKVVRAAAGAWPGLALAEGVDAERLMAELLAHRFSVLVSDPKGTHDFREPLWRGRAALIVGSEAHGVSAALRRSATARVRIPLRARAESLNVAAAAAVLLAEATRQRGLT